MPLLDERLGYRLDEPVPENQAASPSALNLPARVGVAPAVKNGVLYRHGHRSTTVPGFYTFSEATARI